jgi:hypothetical protein
MYSHTSGSSGETIARRKFWLSSAERTAAGGGNDGTSNRASGYLWQSNEVVTNNKASGYLTKLTYQNPATGQ